MKAMFTKPVLTKIVGRPKFCSISKIFQETCENAARVNTDLGGGQHGLTGILLPPDLYQGMSNTPMIIPPNPGPMPNIINLNEIQARHATMMHKNTLVKYHKINTFIKVARVMIVKAVDDQYLDSLKQPIIGYCNTPINEVF